MTVALTTLQLHGGTHVLLVTPGNYEKLSFTLSSNLAAHAGILINQLNTFHRFEYSYEI